MLRGFTSVTLYPRHQASCRCARLTACVRLHQKHRKLIPACGLEETRHNNRQCNFLSPAHDACSAHPQAKLGFPATVAQMTHEIVAADRADAAVKISLEGMTAGYMVELTEITNAMVQAGFYSDANEIAKVPAKSLTQGQRSELSCKRGCRERSCATQPRPRLNSRSTAVQFLPRRPRPAVKAIHGPMFLMRGAGPPVQGSRVLCGLQVSGVMWC